MVREGSSHRNRQARVRSMLPELHLDGIVFFLICIQSAIFLAFQEVMECSCYCQIG